MRKIILTAAFTAFCLLALFPEVSLAQTSSTGWLNTINGPASVMQTTAGYGNTTLGSIIATIIKMALGLLGVIFLVLIVFSGYRWMTASGNEDAVNKAKHTLRTAIIGLLIVLLAFSITVFIFKQLPMSGSTNNAPITG